MFPLCNAVVKVYAHTREECEEKLKDLVQKMKAELAAERERAGRTF